MKWEFELTEIQKCFEIGHVPRWTIIETSRSQTVAEHSYNVACLLLEFGKYTELEEDMIELALLHDIDESMTGDIPTPTKEEYFNDEYNERKSDHMNRTDKLLYLADKLEALIFIEKYGVGPRAEWARDELKHKIKVKAKAWGDQYNFVWQVYKELTYAK